MTTKIRDQRPVLQHSHHMVYLRDDTFIFHHCIAQVQVAAAGSSSHPGVDVKWAETVLEVTRPYLVQNIKPGTKFTYGSDCSGIDAPYWAVRKIFEGLHKVLRDSEECSVN